jgi:hypothetical protein
LNTNGRPLIEIEEPHETRSSADDAYWPPLPRRIGKVIAIPQVDGLHHRYERIAA